MYCRILVRYIYIYKLAILIHDSFCICLHTFNTPPYNRENCFQCFPNRKEEGCVREYQGESCVQLVRLPIYSKVKEGQNESQLFPLSSLLFLFCFVFKRCFYTIEEVKGKNKSRGVNDERMLHSTIFVGKKKDGHLSRSNNEQMFKTILYECTIRLYWFCLSVLFCFVLFERRQLLILLLIILA